MGTYRGKSGSATIDRPRSGKPRGSRWPIIALGAVGLMATAYGAVRIRGNMALSESYHKLDSGDIAGAISAARMAVSLLPRDANALAQLGKSLSRAHDHSGAYSAFKRAFDIDQTDRDVFLALCHEGLYQTALDTQLSQLKEFVNSHPDDARAMLQLGQTYERLTSTPDNEQQAITWEENAAKADPGDEEIEATLGARFVSVNHPLDALKCYNDGLDKNPNSPTLLRGALLCSDELGQTSVAAGFAARLESLPTATADAVDDIPPFRPPAPITPTTGPTDVPARFVDVAASAGLTHNFQMVDSKPQNILQTIGNGCAFLDYNNDGNLDVLLVDHIVKLYEGDGKGHFTDRSHELGLDKIHGYFLGCAVGDYDNDGYDDILLTGYNTVALLHNEAGKGFVDVTKQSGIKTDGWSTCAAWGDIDNDGKLDLYICNYAVFPPGDMGLCVMENLLSGCGPNKFNPQQGRLYRDLGNGKFADVTKQWGVDNTSGKGLGAAFADFDGSGRQSLYIANDQLPSNLYVNTGTRFQDIGRASGTSVREDGKGYSGMGVDWGDYDNDGKLDLAAMDFQWEDKRVFHNDGNHLFTQQFTNLGMRKGSYPWVAFGTKWFDFDNDGWLDMVYCSGHTDDNIQERESDLTFLEPTMLYHNDNGTHFTDASAGLIGPARRPIEGRGLAIGDYENNGRVDVLITNSLGIPLLLHNETVNMGHWLDINLAGTKSNRDGYGARVVAVSGGLRKTRICHSDGSYMSSSDKRVHLGLGNSTAVDSLEIHWPSGTVDKLANVDADRVISVVEGKGSQR